MLLGGGGARGVYYGDSEGSNPTVSSGKTRVEAELYLPFHFLAPPIGEKELSSKILRHRIIHDVLKGKSWNWFGFGESPESILPIGSFAVNALRAAIWFDADLPPAKIDKFFIFLSAHGGRPRTSSRFTHIGNGYWAVNDQRDSGTMTSGDESEGAQKLNALGSKPKPRKNNRQTLSSKRASKRKPEVYSEGGDGLAPRDIQPSAVLKNPTFTEQPPAKRAKLAVVGRQDRQDNDVRSSKVKLGGMTKFRTAAATARVRQGHGRRQKNTSEGHSSTVSQTQPIAGPSWTNPTSNAPPPSFAARDGSPMEIDSAPSDVDEPPDADGDIVMKDAKPLPPVQPPHQCAACSSNSMAMVQYRPVFFGCDGQSTFTFTCPPQQVSRTSSDIPAQPVGTTSVSETQRYIAPAPSAPRHRVSSYRIERKSTRVSSALVNEPPLPVYASVVTAERPCTPRTHNADQSEERYEASEASSTHPARSTTTDIPHHTAVCPEHDTPAQINTMTPSDVGYDENNGESIVAFYVSWLLFVVCAAAMWVVLWRWITGTL